MSNNFYVGVAQTNQHNFSNNLILSATMTEVSISGKDISSMHTFSIVRLVFA